MKRILISALLLSFSVCTLSAEPKYVEKPKEKKANFFASKKNISWLVGIGSLFVAAGGATLAYKHHEHQKKHHTDGYQ